MCYLRTYYYIEERDYGKRRTVIILYVYIFFLMLIQYYNKIMCWPEHRHFRPLIRGSLLQCDVYLLPVQWCSGVSEFIYSPCPWYFAVQRWYYRRLYITYAYADWNCVARRMKTKRVKKSTTESFSSCILLLLKQRRQSFEVFSDFYNTTCVHLRFYHYNFVVRLHRNILYSPPILKKIQYYAYSRYNDRV